MMGIGLGQALATVAAAAAAAALPPTADPRPRSRGFPSVRAAIESTLAETNPVVVGFGEWHQTSATAALEPALRRFAEQVLPTLAPRLSHFIVETWMLSGRCGPVEDTVSKELARSIDRPAATEDDITGALRTAHALGAAPRILSLSCDDYRAMHSAPESGATVDYDTTLRLTTAALRRTVESALVERARRPRPGEGATTARPFVAVYGGALHNDVYPLPGLAGYSYARAIRFATLGRYLEIDLVVPEYAETSPLLRAQDWWGIYRRARRPGRATRIRRGPSAFVIVFPAVGGATTPAAAERDPR